MSTGTAHVPDAAQPDERHSALRHPVANLDDTDRATTRLVVVSIVATLAVAWTLVLVYAYVAQEGIAVTTGPRVLLAFAVALVPGLLAAWAVRLVSATSEGTPTPYVVVAAICVVLMLCGVAIMAEFGERAHEEPPPGGPATVVAQLVGGPVVDVVPASVIEAVGLG